MSTTTTFTWTQTRTVMSKIVAGRLVYWVRCGTCSSWRWAGFENRTPRHTRRVWGVGWGGKPMHLPCPGSERP